MQYTTAVRMKLLSRKSGFVSGCLLTAVFVVAAKLQNLKEAYKAFNGALTVAITKSKIFCKLLNVLSKFDYSLFQKITF